MVATPRRHHYVTAAYLKGFLETGHQHLICYGRRRQVPFRATPEKLANLRDYYASRKNGTTDYSLETEIEREVEGPGLAVIRKLISGRTNISWQERHHLAKLIALQSVRIPYERDFMESNHKATLLGYIADMDEASRDAGRSVDAIEVGVSAVDDPRLINWRRVTRQEVLQELRELAHDPGSGSRHLLLYLSGKISEIYVDMDWTVFNISGSDRFTTSDRPMIVSYPDRIGRGRGIKDPRTEVIFPLAGKILLKMRHRNWMLSAIRRKRSKSEVKQRPTLKWLDASPELVKAANQHQVERAYFWVFSGSERSSLEDWMTSPSKEPKRVTIVDESAGENISSAMPRMIRKRQFIFDHEQ